uniref:CLU central domain-containing protein n=1 Tax=Globisporangium ultimum (strain ATCC 200006 / CBS 805.95 / DAOM BR144) TaxID=431595 RepID=K3X1B5_GLOUD
MAQRSVLEVLELHLPKLIQSFQLYGKENAIASDEDTSSTISLDGFLDFLNAYFEYEEYFSFQQIEQMVNELKDAFAPSLEPELGPQEMYFAHFVELFCRVASGYHNQLLVREGAQLRRVVESCRLEFSIEILLQHMNIKILRDDSSPHASTSSSGTRRQQRKSYMEPPRPVGETGATEPDMEGLTLEIDTRIGDETRTFESVIDEIRIHLEAFERANAAINKRTKRVQSMLFARLPPRKVSPRCDDPAAIAIRDGYYGISEKIPLVTLIRELMTPPPLPTRVLTKLESAMTYQNMGQYHMALGVLEDCKARYRESSNDADIGLDDVEVQVFFHLMIASVLDSARNDFQALLHYYKALKVADTLTLHHPGRVLVKSCLGCMLYYAGEIGLAKKCHQHVLDARRLAVGDEHIDTATAMNNLACCFSQDPTGTAMEEAFLLLKNAKRIYLEAFGASHPRVEVMMRNLEHVNVCQRMIVVDPVGAVERGEYAHIIPGSRFQIQALVPNVALKKSTAKTGKKKKKGAKQKK